SGGYLIHAWNYLGEEPPGWPKQTGGWVIASVGVGDFDGDGTFDVAVTTRDGWLFAWKTDGKAGESLFEWNGFNHDPHNTGNYETSPTPYKTWSGEVTTPEADATGGEGDTTGDDATEEEAPAPSDGGGCGGPAGPAWLTLLALCLVLSMGRRRRAS
ncbi:MAG: alkaline serine protease, partial [Myxococcota bacterium]|nr:alkaline serine protease [Myxococcota bacterium]